MPAGALAFAGVAADMWASNQVGQIPEWIQRWVLYVAFIPSALCMFVAMFVWAFMRGPLVPPPLRGRPGYFAARRLYREMRARGETLHRDE